MITVHSIFRAIVVTLLIGAFLIAEHFHIPLCPFAAATHLPCPGCGLTRATLRLLQGDFAGAFHFHPLSFIISPIAIFALVTNIYGYLRHGRHQLFETFEGPWLSNIMGVLAVAMIALWIARFFGALGGPVAV